jgi:outer membrane protein assembly factor BamD
MITRKIQLIPFLILLLSCAGTIHDNDDYEKQFKEAINLIEKEKFISAQELLNTLSIRASHTEIGDDIQYYLGESFFLNEEYQLAIVEYNKLIRRMGFSPLVEKARWRICECYVAMSPKYYLDQLSSEKAIETIQEFLEDYPHSDHKESANKTIHEMRNKLGQKAFETGILYNKLGAHDSAIFAFERMLKNYYDTEFVISAHLEIIRSYGAMNDLEKGEAYYHSHKHIFPEDIDQEAVEIISNLKTRLSKKG